MGGRTDPWRITQTRHPRLQAHHSIAIPFFPNVSLMQKSGVYSELCSTVYALPLPIRLTNGAPPSAALCLSFPLSTSLWSLVVPAATSLGEHTILLNLAVETFEC